jgi:hypothetical protein
MVLNSSDFVELFIRMSSIARGTKMAVQEKTRITYLATTPTLLKAIFVGAPFMQVLSGKTEGSTFVITWVICPIFHRRQSMG